MARSVTVTLSANVSSYIAAMGQAAAATSAMADRAQQATGRITRAASQNTQEWNQVAGTLTKVGAVAAAGLGVAAKAAIDWESAFAGVKKTVDGTPQQIAALEGELRQMARTMATSHRDIAATAEAAGQLGVATEDVAGFTRTMIMLGETTNLTADQAATSMSQFMTIMGTAPDQVGNLGAALVGLGNNSATTESQILQMSQRIAGAGTAIGLTEADVMGFSAAIASTGIEVEAGGTAISNSMLKMEQAVRNGGRELDILAQTAGMSGAQFKQAFQEDAAGAIQAFIEGLGRVGAEGGDVTAILRDLGITGIREADTLRRLANAGSLLGDSLKLAGDEMASGSALIEEYGQRADTTASKIQVAWNNIKDAAITAGAATLPIIGDIAGRAASLAEAFGQLPAPAQQGATAIAAVVAAGGLAAGGLMRGVSSALEFSSAMSTLASNSPRAAGAIRGLGAAAGIATAALVGLAAVQWVGSSYQAGVDATRISIEGMGNAARLAAQGDLSVLDTEIRAISESTIDLGLAFWNVSDAQGTFMRGFGQGLDALTGTKNELTQMEEAIAKLDGALASANMPLAEAQSAFREVADSASQYGVTTLQVSEQLPQFKARMDDLLASMGGIKISAQEYADWMGGKIPDAVLRAAAANEQYAQILADATGSMDDAAAAARRFAVDAAASTPQAQAMADALRTIPPVTEATIWTTDMAPMTMQAQDLKAKLEELPADKIITVTLPNGESVTGTVAEIQAGIERIQDEKAIWLSTPGGVEAVDQVTALAFELAAVPDEKETSLSIDGAEAVHGSLSSLIGMLDGIPDEKPVTITLPNGALVQSTAGEIRAAIEQIPANKDILLQTIADLGGQREVATAVEGTDGKIVTVGTVADLSGQVTAQVGIDSTTGKVVIVGTAEDLSGQRRAQMAVDATTGKTVWIRTDADLGAVARARAEIARLQNRTVYITTVHQTVGVTSNMRFGGVTRADGGTIPAYSGPAPAGFAGAQRLSVGGMVAGWSPHPKADNVPIWGTAGEVMMSNAAGDAYGRSRLLALNSRRVDPHDFAAFMHAQGLADGGQVREAFSRPAPMPATGTTGAGQPGTVINRTFQQTNNTYYPVAARESDRVKQAAAGAAMEAMFG